MNTTIISSLNPTSIDEYKENKIHPKKSRYNNNMLINPQNKYFISPIILHYVPGQKKNKTNPEPKALGWKLLVKQICKWRYSLTLKYIISYFSCYHPSSYIVKEKK